MHFIFFQSLYQKKKVLKPFSGLFIQFMLCLVITLFYHDFCPTAHALDMFYGKCVKAYQFTDDEIDAFSLTPGNNICYERCRTECEAFSRKAYLPRDPSLKNYGEVDQGIELNQEVIDECMVKCQNGEIFSSVYRKSAAFSYDQCKSKTTEECLNIIYSGPTSTGTACFDARKECEDSNESSLSKQDNSQVSGKCKEKICGPTGYKKGWARDGSYQTSIYAPAKKETKVIINLFIGEGQTQDNKVYLCGHKLMTLNPIFPNIHAADSTTLASDWWDDKSSPPKAWPSDQDHPCFLGNADPCNSSSAVINYEESSNKSLWSNMSEDKCSWNARNLCYTNTEIYPKNGDELSIRWRGDYGFDPTQDGENYTNRKASIDCITSTNTSASKSKKCRDNWNKATTLQLKINGEKINLEGEGMRTTSLIESMDDNADSTGDSGKLFKILGLVGGMNPKEVEYECNQNNSSCYCLQGNDNEMLRNPKCILFTKTGIGNYHYSGILSGLDSTGGLLEIKHYYPNNIESFCPTNSTNDTDKLNSISGSNLLTNGGSTNSGSSSIPKYQNAIGGFEIDIEWRGCPFANGQRLQYVIAPDGSNYKEKGISEEDWIDVPETIFQPNNESKEANNILTLNPDSSGYLFFRIKPLDPPGNEAIDILYTHPGHWKGQYNLSVQDASSSPVKLTNGVIRDLLNSIIKSLFGSNGVNSLSGGDDSIKGGIIYSMYNGIVENTYFIIFVRAFLIFYITFLGIGFLLGTVQFNSQELLFRILKVGFVVTIISHGSWEFFYTYMIPLFIGGMLEILEIFATASSFSDGMISYSDIKEDPLSLFAIFDGPLKMMFSSATWKKIAALIFSGLAGFLVVLVIIAGIAMYLFTIAQVILMFMVVLAGMSILLVIAPIIIPFILFEQTKAFFDNWIKSLISYFLQPIMVFATMGAFNIVIITIFQMMLAFTACQTCYLYVDLSVYKACWIPGYTTTLSQHIPDVVGTGFSLPQGILERSLAFLMVTASAMSLCTWITRLVGVIVQGIQIIENDIGHAVERFKATEMTRAVDRSSWASSQAVKYAIRPKFAETSEAVARKVYKGPSQLREGSEAKLNNTLKKHKK